MQAAPGTPAFGEPSSSRPRSGVPASLVRSALDKVNELWEDEEASVKARAAKRSAARATTATSSAANRACSGCRRAKQRCFSTSDQEACPRCVNLGLACVYPELRNRGPKKRLSRTQRILREIKRDLELALTGGSADPLDETSGEEESGPEDEVVKSSPDASADLRNPLAVLASAVDAEEEQGIVDYARARGESQLPAGGLYAARFETDFSTDPVQADILHLTDLQRLIEIYFSHLRPFLWLLLPELHTVDFLRSTSPFLTTAIAAVSATYDPLSAHLTAPLYQHALHLATEALHAGLRSLEIAQAFFILSHWSTPTTWSDDRSWQWLGQAWRTATEIRIDLLPQHRDEQASHGKDLDPHRRNRLSTFSCLFCGELAIAVQTGRIDCLRLVPPSIATDLTPTSLAPELPDYNYSANLVVNCIFAKALHLAAGLREEAGTGDLRKSFLSFWKPQMEDWRKRWPLINSFIDVHAENNAIILNLMSLGFEGGSTESILADCRAAAVRAIQKVSSWEDRETQLPFASNFVIVNIAYGAGILLQLSQRFQHALDPSLREKILRVVDVLQRIGKNRPNSPSLATVHAVRLRRMVASFGQQPPANPSLYTSSAAERSPLPLNPPTFFAPSSDIAATRLYPPTFPPLPSINPAILPPSLPSPPRLPSANNFAAGSSGAGAGASFQMPIFDFAEPLPDAARDFLGMAVNDPMMAWMQGEPAPGDWGAWETLFGGQGL